MPRKKRIVKKKKKINSKNTDRKILEEVIRVDHAGEYGATRIYDGQIAVSVKIRKLAKQFNIWLIKNKNI